MTRNQLFRSLAAHLKIAAAGAAIALATGCAEPRAFSDEATPAALIVPPLIPPVAVAQIEGAPEDWEIPERVAKALRAHDIPASTGAVEKSAYVLKGEFAQSPARNGEVAVRVTWRLFDSQQRQIAETTHLATLAPSLLQQSKAEVADGLARATAERLAPLLPSGAARAEPGDGAQPAPRRLERPPEPEPDLSTLPLQRAEEPNTRSDVDLGGRPMARARQQFWVQIGSHKDEAQSRAEWPKLQAAAGELLRNAPHRIARADLGAKGVFYRVQVGPYASAAEAGGLCAQLKTRSVDCFLAIEQATARPEAAPPVAKPEPKPAAKPETVTVPAPPKPEAKPATPPTPMAKPEPKSAKPETVTAPPKPEAKPAAPAPVAKPAPDDVKDRTRVLVGKPPVFKQPESQPPAARPPPAPEKPSATRDDAPTSTAPGLPGVID